MYRSKSYFYRRLNCHFLLCRCSVKRSGSGRAQDGSRYVSPRNNVPKSHNHRDTAWTLWSETGQWLDEWEFIQVRRGLFSPSSANINPLRAVQCPMCRSTALFSSTSRTVESRLRIGTFMPIPNLAPQWISFHTQWFRILLTTMTKFKPTAYLIQLL
jgi:hypothetical protein